LSLFSFSPKDDQQIAEIIEPLVASLEPKFEMSSHGAVGDENTQKKPIPFEQQEENAIHDFYDPMEDYLEDFLISKLIFTSCKCELLYYLFSCFSVLCLIKYGRQF